MDEQAIAMVAAWHDALNAGAVERLLALSAGDIEVGGPRGTGRGTDLLREWIGRAQIRIEPRRVFARDGTVVVEQAASWRAPDSGEQTPPQPAASVFRVRDGRVSSVIRHGNLPAALAAASLDESDQVARPVP